MTLFVSLGGILVRPRSNSLLLLGETFDQKTLKVKRRAKFELKCGVW
mgnify:CR=1 FL=1